MPVQLLLRVGVLLDAVQILALGHELEGQRRADHRLAARPRRQAADMRVANAQAAQFAAGGRAANLRQAVDHFLGGSLDVRCLDHWGFSFYTMGSRRKNSQQ